MGRFPKTTAFMASTQTNSASPLFMGEFRHAIDGKSRVTIPSAWRYEEEAEFFLRPSSDGQCLKVMPLCEVERIRAAAAQLPGPQRVQFLRELGAGTRQCRLDKAGRLVLPEDFCKTLQLFGEITLAGAIESFEIWNAQSWSVAKTKTEALAAQHLADFGL
jgi:MraZ protein